MPPLFETSIFFLVGLVLLIKGADIFVDGAASLACRLNISRLVIGLTVVSMGTSAPELVVNVIAAFKGNTDLAVGNIIGSNNANLMLILGVSAFLFPISISHSTAWREIPFSLFTLFLLFCCANGALINPYFSSDITRRNGLVLFLFFFIFLFYVYRMSRDRVDDGESHIKRMGIRLSLGYILLGLAGLTLGGRWLVESAVEIARMFDLSEALIGLTLVALGTSLPELAVSVTAAFKKHSEIAIGNAVGSNILNILWVLGLTAIIHPLTWNPKLNLDVGVCAFATVLLFAFYFTGKKYTMERWEGGIFLFFYCGYIVYLFSGRY